MYDLIILGGGPAGLTAAVYALRKRLNVLLISNDLGGKTNYHLQLPDVSHHLVINGSEVVSHFANEIEYLEFARVLDGAETVEALPPDEGAPGYRVTTRSGKQYAARALIVATGANARRLNVPGESDYLMRGVVYSAVSYASLFVDGVTAVVGSSALALRSAAELARVARRVTLIAASETELSTPLGRHLVAMPNVVILTGYHVDRITGDDYARALVVSGHGEQREVAADAIFVELGLEANSELVAELVARDPNGRILVDTNNRTSAPGLFAAGDVTNVYAEQVLVAIGEGTKATLSAYDYLLEHPVLRVSETPEWR